MPSQVWGFFSELASLDMKLTETLVLPNTAHSGFEQLIQTTSPDWASEEALDNYRVWVAQRVWGEAAHTARVPADAGNRPA